jgi:hypothetical protein
MFKEPGKIQLSHLNPSYLQKEAKRASYDPKMQQKSKALPKGFLWKLYPRLKLHLKGFPVLLYEPLHPHIVVSKTSGIL